MKKKEFIVIGVGQFGRNLILTLANAGVDVLVIDKNPTVLEEISEIGVHTICADASNPDVLQQLDIRSFDGAVVTIGHALETSVLISIQLKELGIPFLMVKATTDLHGRILRKIGADKIVFPDREMGIRTGNRIAGGNYFDMIELSSQYSISDLPVPTDWCGKTIAELDIRHKYGVNILGIRKGELLHINPGPDAKLAENDILVILGENTTITSLMSL